MGVDPAARWPLAAQLAQLLRVLIRSGRLACGDRVPSEHELASEHGVSRDTAHRALAMLTAEGLITRRRGVGSIVTATRTFAEVTVAPGTRISARLPTAKERESAGAGAWVPVLAVTEPGVAERLYPADSVVIAVPAADESSESPSAYHSPYSTDVS
jgi:DNA-binding transcriptional regulator YhcF (GntR family)